MKNRIKLMLVVLVIIPSIVVLSGCGLIGAGLILPDRENQVPSAVTSLNVFAGNGQVTLFWNEPTMDGGSPILRYEVRVTYANGVHMEWTGVGLAQIFTVTGLTNGTQYLFFVRAVNEVGAGISQQRAAVPSA